MATQSPEVTVGRPGVARRPARAHRILDAAAALILRWGYDKTSVDDISRQAGVAKGTIYLHWKTREGLFRALWKRENVAWLEDFERRVTQDPAGSTLRGVLRHSALALMKRPLLKALFLRDPEVLGKLAQSERGGTVAKEKLAGFSGYLELLREHGLVRTDLSQRQQLYMLSAISLGFFLVAPLVPDELALSDEELAELLAETVHRALAAGPCVSAAEAQPASPTFLQYMHRYAAVVREQFRQEMES